MDHPRRLEGPHRYARREFLKRAAAAGIALPSLSAILAACGGGAQTGVGGGSTASGSSGTNPYGTGGIAGAPYPLARQEAPVTWNVDPADVTASGQQPESGATLKVLRWPYYLDDGVVKAFEKQYNTTVQITEFSDMDKGLARDQLRQRRLRHHVRHERVGSRAVDRGGSPPPLQPRLPDELHEQRLGLVPEPVLRPGSQLHRPVQRLEYRHLLAERQGLDRPGDPWPTRTTCSSTARRRARRRCSRTRRTCSRCRCSTTGSRT